MSNIEALEQRISDKISPAVASELSVSSEAGGLSFANMAQVMEFAKLMSVAKIAVPEHLRGNPGACMGVVLQAIEWRMSPFAVANKSYSVRDRLAFEAQLIQAVVLQRAPIKGRIKVEFSGDGNDRICKVWATLRDGETVDYVSPPCGRIPVKNSPLWKADPDQQQFYYSVRALARRHFPDVILGVYAADELEGDGRQMRDVTPAAVNTDRLLTKLQAAPPTTDPVGFDPHHIDAVTGEILGSQGVSPAPETAPANPPAGAQGAGAGVTGPAPAPDDDPFSVDLPHVAEKPTKPSPSYVGGQRAAQDGVSRKSVPDDVDHDEWLRGYDDGRKVEAR